MEKTIIGQQKPLASNTTATIPYISVLSPNHESKTYRLQGGALTIGRDKSCDIIIEDNLVSRTHCQLWTNSSGTVVVRDMGSTNGTLIDTKAIEQDVLLPHNRLKIGNHIIKVEFKNADEVLREAILVEE